MTILFVILPLTLLFSSGFVAAYVWATRTGQLDDLETPPMRALHDDSRALFVTTHQSAGVRRADPKDRQG